MMQKKPSLGRGLEALMGHAITRPTAAGGQPAAASGEELAKLPLDRLQRGRYQPRMDLRPETLQELADSIKAQGVVQPIVVRPIDGASAFEPQRYEIIAGERRWRAAQMAGLTEIPALVRRIADDAVIAVALIENIQRESLNPLEEARALDRLVREFQMTHQQAADAVGRSRAAVSNLLRLLDLAPELSELLEKRELEMGHARALLALSTRRQQAEVGALVAKKGISVRETEAIVRRLVAPAKAPGAAGAAACDPDVERLERDLAEKLAAKVTIRHASTGKGKLIVDYNSLEELEGILAHIQ
ncbi:MAG TPA: ParB/RepB/Spo0J family partition protein [Steroidobacteraceae bacterium]|nr:ParB/RepB/Spo0J family partition protein [Steroidobacteraceae bacterium]